MWYRGPTVDEGSIVLDFHVRGMLNPCPKSRIPSILPKFAPHVMSKSKHFALEYIESVDSMVMKVSEPSQYSLKRRCVELSSARGSSHLEIVDTQVPRNALCMGSHYGKGQLKRGG